IACNNTLYIIPKEKQLDTLKEFYRILKPGGKIVITNPVRGAKPLKIYFEGLKKNFKKYGFLQTFKTAISVIFPTIQMLYYNSKIKKESEKGGYCFLELEEQQELLKKSGFRNVSQVKFVYANQSILNYGFK
ncbi:class I SAM-dependent methyltransferase, partial [Candidatus Parcubacteria bacterium]|nr:class I SAM-dependent methyltransferase [Candidatus Parcubacteria bacterium]